ncbi:MAG: hypothetical protein ACR2KK_13685 [Acidimicrobiales bacterium]
MVSAEGRPSFRLFEEGPLRGAETAFSRNFEALREAVEGVGSIRYVMIPPTPVFGPLVISACLLANGDMEVVSVIEHEDYWGLIDDSPA